MKRLLLYFTVVLTACASPSSRVANVSCRIGDEVVKQLELYKLADGKKVLIASAVPDSTHFFGFQFVPDYEGFYIIGDQRQNQYPIYVKAGEQSSVFIGKDTVYLDGENNSEEMKVLYEWQGLSYTLESNACRFWSSDWTYRQVYPAFEAFFPNFDAFKSRIRTDNPRFNELMARYVDYSKDWYLLMFSHTPRREWPSPMPRIDYHSRIIAPEKLEDDMILNMPWGALYLQDYVSFYKQEKGLDDKDLKGVLAAVPNPRLKGEMILRQMELSRTYPQYNQLMEEFGKQLNPAQKKRAEVVGAKLYEDKVGMPAPDFTCEDIKGKKVSLSDFKGKVILIDVWATWCGPCRGELPYLKKLEKAFQGKEVAFISVSVDAPKDKEKWAKMVKDAKLGGIQLFGGDGWKSKIAQDFKINAIPRFILIDKEGKVVNSAAPRPSEPALKQLLEIQLRK